MSTELILDAETEAMIDRLLASNRFADRMALLRHAVALVHAEYRSDAAIDVLLDRRRAAADADPNGGIAAEDVFAEMERLCLEDIQRQRHAA